MSDPANGLFTFPAVISQKYNLETQNRNNTISIPTSQRLIFNDADVTLQQANVYYSWYNISAAYGNNIMAYAWPSPTTPEEYYVFGVSDPPYNNNSLVDTDPSLHLNARGIYGSSVPTLPDGIYSYDQLNTILQAQMAYDGNIPVLGSGQSPAGTPATFLSFGLAATKYAVEITTNPIGTDTIFTNTNWSDWPSSGNLATPLLLFNPSPFGAGIPGKTPGVQPTGASVSSFSRLMGFQLIPGGNISSGNLVHWGGGGSEYSTIPWTAYPLDAVGGNQPFPSLPDSVFSQFPPRIDIVDVVNINCNLVNSQYINNYSNVIFSFSPKNIAFGSTISITPTIASWVSISNGSYDSISVFLTDDNNNPLPVLDAQWSATLLIRQKRY